MRGERREERVRGERREEKEERRVDLNRLDKVVS